MTFHVVSIFCRPPQQINLLSGSWPIKILDKSSDQTPTGWFNVQILFIFRFSGISYELNIVNVVNLINNWLVNYYDNQLFLYFIDISADKELWIHIIYPKFQMMDTIEGLVIGGH